MSKVLVTGASGFLGSHIADELTRSGFDVILFDKATSPYLNHNQKMITGDLLDNKLLEEITSGVDFVYHFAAIADIDSANMSPYQTIVTNILGTTNLIEACIKNDVKKFLFASTVYVYSDKGGFYSVTKKCCEDIIENYAKIRGGQLSYVILRYGTLYGNRSNIKNGCYKIVKGILENEKFSYDGTGEEVREFINVLDAAKISVQCLSEEIQNERLILTGAERMRMKDLIQMVKEITKRDCYIEYLGNKNPLHYNITPYNYTPKLGRKIVNNPHIDIGQGLIELVKEVIGNERIKEDALSLPQA